MNNKNFIFAITSVLLLSSFMIPINDAFAVTWYDDSWSYRNEITLDNSMVSGSSDLSNFPILISFTSNDLNNTRISDENEFRFTSSDGSTLLDYEIESFTNDGSSGTIVAWVKIPTLDYNDDTVLYVYYGNTGVSSVANSANVYDSNYKGVWHLNQTTTADTGGIKDVSGNTRHGTANFAPTFSVTGKIGNAIDFDGMNDFISVPYTADLNPAQFTISAWAKSADDDNNYHSVITSRKESPTQGYIIYDATGDTWQTWVGDGSAGSWVKLDTSTATTNWTYLTALYDGTNLKIYVDGVFSKSITITYVANTESSLIIGAGAFDGSNFEFDGTIDEVRISNVARSAGWITTSYNNQDSPGTYFTIATAESVPTTTTTTKKSSSDCYDCKPPTLQEAHIAILSDDYVIATGDDPLHITANVGDRITVILNVTDNKSIDTIPFAALYTNFQEKPDSMSAFYANNFDKWKHVSTSFYEWNVRADDVAYDYDGTVSWSENFPTVVTDVLTEENYFMINDDNVLEYFMMPFTFTINDFMEESTITAKIYDAAGNRLHVTLPVTLQTAGNDPINFDHMGKQKVLGFYDESTLSEMVETWSESESNSKQLSVLLGVSDEELPTWTSNLATWVSEDKIDSADMIIAVEYLINQ